MKTFTNEEVLKETLFKIKTIKNEIHDIKHEPIAIIGMSCRFPGGANDTTQFWNLLEQGFDAVTEIPSSRWDVEEYYSLDENAFNKGYARHGAFLTIPIDEFDPVFFNITPREAKMMDPRQRLLLEVTWEALENAGIVPRTLRGSPTGVFIGMMSNDYAQLLYDVKQTNAQIGVGIANSILSGRISYVLGLQGPCVALDTACSSSLVTVHQACQSLRLGESTLAIAAGVNLMLSPYPHVGGAKEHMLAKNGLCKTFDKSADGYVRGEGCGVIILKRLRDAVRDGDAILAVIRGSAVNQDGASGGLSVPNRQAQEQVIRNALKQAELLPNDIDYIEAHGTGTSLGDPIEMHALQEVFGENRTQPLIVGTVKTNVGHLEAAAGIVGVIKTVLAIVHEKIPRHLHLHEVNPEIDVTQIPVQIPLKNLPWPYNATKVRYAGVSSFGFSGTNAHVIIEEAPKLKVLDRVSLPDDYLLVVSAKNKSALLIQINQHIEYLKTTSEHIADICYSSQVAREHFEFRVAVRGKAIEELLQKLQQEQWASDEIANKYVQGEPINWSELNKPYRNSVKKVVLPHYPFQRKKYWAECLVTAKIQPSSIAAPPPISQVLVPSGNILEMVREITLFVNGFEPTEEYDDKGFFDMGMDSLMAVELGKLLSERFTGIKINAEVVFNYSSIKKLAEYIENELAGKIPEEESIYVTSNKDEPIAIIGMGCRFPGIGENIDGFAQLLRSGIDAGQEIPINRWDMTAYYDPQIPTPGKIYINRAALVTTAIEDFDADFFGISPREAEVLDPQQRMLLEVTWEALENAGIPPDSLMNKRGAVMLGIYSNEFRDYLRGATDEYRLSFYTSTGNDIATASGRIAYFLGLQGPCFSVDTACSSALVALHQACKSLQSGESTIAIAGGVNLLFSPEAMAMECSLRMLSPEGKCKTFDKSADGFMRGEGCGIVILKPLSAAQNEGDTILAVIKGSAINQDGAGSGLTVPNGLAQQKVIRQALANAKLAPNAIDYIETHGTGTSLGDPIEVGALRAIFSGDRAQPLIISSVKTNIGHLEAAAGIAGLIKTVVALNEELIPKHLHFTELNPEIDLSAIPAQIPLENLVWQKNKERVRIAGISAFGYSGTNAHIIVEEYQKNEVLRDSLPTECLLLISAKTEKALKQQIENYSVFIEKTNQPIADICYTSQVGRTHYKYRRAVSGNNKEELLENLTNQVAPLNELAQAYLRGESIDWRSKALSYRDKLKRVALPNYPWQRQRHWVKLKPSLGNSDLTFIQPLLQSKIQLPDNDNIYYQSKISKRYPDFIEDHKVFNYSVLAGACYVSMALSWLQKQQPGTYAKISTVEFFSPLIVDDANATISLWMKISRLDTRFAIEIFSRNDVEAITINHARMQAEFVDNFLVFPMLSDIRSGFPDLVNYTKEQHSQKIHQLGLTLGSRFNWIAEGYISENSVLIKLRARQECDFEENYFIFPGLLDSCWQGALALMGETIQELSIPVGINTIIYDLSDNSRKPSWVVAEIVTNETGSRTNQANFIIYDEVGQVLANVEGLITAPVNQNTLLQQFQKPQDLYQFRWELQALVNLISGIPVIYDARCKQDALMDLSNATKLLVFLQNMIKTNTSGPVIIVTCNAYVITDETININQAMLNGMIKTLILEQPQLKLKHLDVDNLDYTQDELIQLAQKMDAREDIIVYRKQQLYVPRLISFKANITQFIENTFSSQASYLITGGLGGLGLALAQYLIEQGCKRIILVGRHQPSNQALSQIDDWRKCGIEVIIEQRDISERNQVQDLIECAHQEGAPLRGIFHLAGVLVDAPLMQQTAETFSQVFAAKAQGAWFLHEAVNQKVIPLDYFVTYSSIASLLGSIGQSNYALANSFLDALAYYRQEQNLPAISINWGAWSEAGMAKENIARYQNQGMKPITNAQGLSTLNQILKNITLPQVAVFSVQWQKIIDNKRYMPSWLIEVTKNFVPSIKFITKLNKEPKDLQETLLKQFLENEVKNVLRLNKESFLDESSGFFELGMDSLTALELRNHLQLELDLTLPNTLLFECPDFSSLFTYIKREMNFIDLEDENNVGIDDHTQIRLEVEKMTDDESYAALEKALGLDTKENLAKKNEENQNE